MPVKDTSSKIELLFPLPQVDSESYWKFAEQYEGKLNEFLHALNNTKPNDFTQPSLD